MKRNLFKLKAVFVMLALCVTAAACVGGQGNTPSDDAATRQTQTSTPTPAPVAQEPATEEPVAEEPSSAPSGDVVTLEVFSMPANTSGLQENYYWTDILARDVGVKIELLPSGDQGEQKLAALMAANAFPDVVVLKTYKHVNDAVAANLLLCLDDYQMELADAFANFPNAIQYFRDNVSNGTGKAYAFPNGIMTDNRSSGSIDYGPYIRWDLYKEIGSPVLNTWEDLLPTLQKMQEAAPVNEDGQKVYGISWWTDWDDDSLQSGSDFAAYHGYNQVSFAEINLANGNIRSIFDEDSLYKRWLNFMFSANQMGLMDPDTISQRWDAYGDKATAGRTLYANWSWGFGSFATPERNEAAIGFRPVFVQDTKMNRGTEANYIGATWPYGISKDTKKLEHALRFVNYMYSAEGNWNLRFGDQGEFWDMDENGPYITEFGFQMRENPDLKFASGSRVMEGMNVINSIGYDNNMVNPIYGVSMNYDTWQRKDFAPPKTNLVLDWEAATGCDDQNNIPFLKSKGLIQEKPFAPMVPLEDDIDVIRMRIGDFCKTQSWQIIFAKDQAEFDTLWAEMVDRAKGMNMDAVVNAIKDNYQKGLSEGAKYMN